MIDNDLHEVLIDAADAAGWDVETMVLMLTRFLCELAGQDTTVEERFQQYLAAQVVAESEVNRHADDTCTHRDTFHDEDANVCGECWDRLPPPKEADDEDV